MRNMPVYMSKNDLLAVLADMGDPVTDPDGPGFRVRASYRIGNSMGQGGLRMIGEWQDEPAQEVTP